MKLFYLVGAILLSVSSVVAQEDSIKNFLRVNKEFCTGGQPSLQHLEKLKVDGVKAIINLRQPTEYAAAEEQAKAKALGLRYFNIPVSPTEPKDNQAKEFLKITDNPDNRPAFIHCRSAARRGFLDDQTCVARRLENRRCLQGSGKDWSGRSSSPKRIRAQVHRESSISREGTGIAE